MTRLQDRLWQAAHGPRSRGAAMRATPRPSQARRSSRPQRAGRGQARSERKHLTDIIKMVAYQTESDLLALLRSHYARADQEGRTLLHELFATAGDIRVGENELHITLAPLSSPHRTHAAEALCEMLDQTATMSPGSHLRMRRRFLRWAKRLGCTTRRCSVASNGRWSKVRWPRWTIALALVGSGRSLSKPRHGWCRWRMCE